MSSSAALPRRSQSICPLSITAAYSAGEKDVVISTERKKLTIFFSDVVNFTATTERMQPEELTALLNEYLTEMSQIAIRHGGSVNKFIGDAMLVFFGDLTTQSVVEDAHACVGMAFEMQRRLAELNGKWRNQGIEQPFRARMGINTGFCNVGNFGSERAYGLHDHWRGSEPRRPAYSPSLSRAKLFSATRPSSW